MPSKDKIDPKANEWMHQAGIPVASGPAVAKPRPVRQRRTMAAQFIKLARRLGRDPEELAKRIPDDTMRRMKYPVLEQITPDGKRVFEHDLGIEDRPITRF